MIDVFAPAKVNLTLHVTGQRDDGYHLLDSLVVFADVGDRLTLTPGPDMSLRVSGPFSDGVPEDPSNLVWRAAELSGWTGAITLEKNLPNGAGIGGGSSDAAAVLNALEASEDGAALGADIPVCRVGCAARMRGVGDVVEPLKVGPVLHAVLANPGAHLATPLVFSGLRSKENPAMPDALPTGGFDDWLSFLATQRNDLEAPAVQACPEIAETLAALSDLPHARLVRMSGSGATCFALFETEGEATAASASIKAAHPGWWVQGCTLA